MSDGLPYVGDAGYLYSDGYPTKNALRSWHREYEQRVDLSALLLAPHEVLEGAEGTSGQSVNSTSTDISLRSVW